MPEFLNNGNHNEERISNAMSLTLRIREITGLWFSTVWWNRTGSVDSAL